MSMEVEPPALIRPTKEQANQPTKDGQGGTEGSYTYQLARLYVCERILLGVQIMYFYIGIL